MDHTARNIWFRALHGTLPTAEGLFPFGVASLDSSLCRLCSTQPESLEHFLVTCPLRYEVWYRVWGPLFYGEPNISSLLEFLLQLRWPDAVPDPPTHRLGLCLYAPCYLDSLLASHFRNIPFSPSQVATTALHPVARERQETSD